LRRNEEGASGGHAAEAIDVTEALLGGVILRTLDLLRCGADTPTGRRTARPLCDLG
jgi:hypothetical protein